MGAVGVLVAIAGVVATFFTWRATQTLARIEKRRWHEDLTPEFDVRIDDNRLAVAFTGPTGLGQLDEVTVTIQDNGGVDRFSQTHAGGPTRDEVAAHIWGPRRFDTDATDQALDDTGRTARAHLIHELGSWHPLLLSPTQPPGWSAPSSADWPVAVKAWARDYGDKPVRVLITCRHGAHEPWNVLHQIDPPPGGWPMPS